MKLATLALAAALLIAGSAIADTCLDCHRDPDFRVKHPKLFEYFQEFDISVHGIEGLSCADCHGGDATSEDLDKAHAGVLEPVRYDRIPDTCGNCHAEQHEAFVTSNHYRVLEGEGTAPNCATCHGAMEMDFIFVTRVKSTCTSCHNDESGLSPEVPSKADYVLNQINVIKGYRSFVNTHAADRTMVDDLEVRYGTLTAKWHRFDLGEIEEDTGLLFADYRKAKGQAMKDRKAKKAEKKAAEESAE